jgi:hypothetical protein
VCVRARVSMYVCVCVCVAMHAPMYSWVLSGWCVATSDRHAPRHYTQQPIHNILLTAPQLSISQKALGTLPDDDNVMPKHVGDKHN